MPTQELRTRAEILHRKIQSGDHQALGRLRSLPNYRRASYEELIAAAATVRRADCLSLIATELGFATWTEAKRVLDGGGATPEVANFGTLLCPRRAAGHLNLWYRTHAEAAGVRSERGGYLLAFRNQFVVVDRGYIADTLGLDPDDPDWTAMGHDWARPADPAARTRLYARLIARLPREAPAP